jgi:pimeloyl-ACP methyl ester carboxylesterase
MPLNEHTLTVNNRNVRYYDAGEPHRDAILLLHGDFGDAALHWKEALEFFAEDYYVIAVDLPGYGKSNKLRRMDIDALVQWTKGVLDGLGIDRTVLIGNSFGALIARVFAAQYPGYAKALVIVNGGTIPAVPGMAKFLARLPLVGSMIYNWLGKSTSSRKELAKVVHVQDILTDDFVARVRENAPALATLMRAMSVSKIPENVTPKVPTLIIWGEDDAIMSIEIGKRLQSQIPGARLSEVSGCGHLPHLEESDVFTFQVKNFLTDLEHGATLPRKGPQMLGQ